MAQKEFDVNHYEITIKETREFQQSLTKTISNTSLHLIPLNSRVMT
ncbi:hypothetical protein [Bombilactobacillus thymidiniphilus]|uniref:Uncharacterized protein n=1 Tax=Bombilactobacillus thymidiniphilus TaxID=2923363 RepID=A0ABY4PDH9_9LACO|nr:hypothetical protein [Bombilactobacillus thymidiniphilus]UQS83337.1 hypothetical protein MOO47_06050 [Bombilactobacillus thymidiniphilus]